METHDLSRILAKHPFFEGMSQEAIALISGCALNVRYEAGDEMFREGTAANQFFIIRRGTVALEMASPQQGAVTFETASDGEVVGYSWLFPPHRWIYSGRAVTLVRALALDGKCLREKCDADPLIGYDMMKRFGRVVLERLQAARLQLLDVYGTGTR